MSNLLEVRLENFQSHLDTSISLHEGLNVIVGQSDSGKTAVLRAVRWALFNQPRGTDFLRVNADFVRVTLTFADGTLLIRERTSSKNRYIIRKPDREEMVLEGFGSQVPEEVLQAHGMRPFRIDRDHEWPLQMSGQLEGPFLLEQTGSLRAKAIGRMSGAHYLDMAIRDVTKDVYTLQQQTKKKEQDAETLKTSLEPFHFLDNAKEKLDRGFRCLQKAKELQTKHDRLEVLQSRMQAHEKLMVETEAALAKVEALPRWERRYEHLQQKQTHLRQLQRFYVHWKEMMTKEKSLQEWLKKTAEIDVAYTTHETLSLHVKRRKQLEHTQAQMKKLQQDEQTCLHAVSQTHFVAQLSTAHLQDISAQARRHAELLRLQKQWKMVDQEMTVTRQMEVDDDHISAATNKLNDVTGATQRLLTLQTCEKSLTELQRRLDEGRVFVAAKKEEEAKLFARYQEKLNTLGVCPTCGQAIEND
ncbi:AAA family ATPase [Shouchella lonarensis]|uniref:Nuclease SbcCD subunit C n=1 Tax=Shouchella lonarensis TaxID=1464122 RepID=A0A1G6LLA1_9BACI|nr:AAA family ATPase [Shouchella lonarensis]SDC43949.1 AAA domain-containing protein [Shouchella lonarensis]